MTPDTIEQMIRVLKFHYGAVKIDYSKLMEYLKTRKTWCQARVVITQNNPFVLIFQDFYIEPFL